MNDRGHDCAPLSDLLAQPGGEHRRRPRLNRKSVFHVPMAI
jgi:hypothetical protein